MTPLRKRVKGGECESEYEGGGGVVSYDIMMVNVTYYECGVRGY